MTSTSRQTVAVHGATGPQGAAVAAALTAAGHTVRVLARHPGRPGTEPGQPVAADLLDAESLERAYAGADAVFVHLPTVFDGDTATAQTENVLTALARSGVGRAVVNPNLVPPPVDVGIPYVDARVRLVRGLNDRVGIAATVAPAAQYMENINAPWSTPLVLEQGVLAYPLPAEFPVPWVALADVAAAVVEALTAAAPRPLTVVTGPQALSGHEAADELAQALSRTVSWKTISGEEYAELLAGHMPADAAAGIGALYSSVLSGAAPPPAPLDPDATVAGPTTLRTWASTNPWPYRAGAGSTAADGHVG